MTPPAARNRSTSPAMSVESINRGGLTSASVMRGLALVIAQPSRVMHGSRSALPELLHGLLPASVMPPVGGLRQLSSRAPSAALAPRTTPETQAQTAATPDQTQHSASGQHESAAHQDRAGQPSRRDQDQPQRRNSPSSGFRTSSPSVARAFPPKPAAALAALARSTSARTRPAALPSVPALRPGRSLPWFLFR